MHISCRAYLNVRHLVIQNSEALELEKVFVIENGIRI